MLDLRSVAQSFDAVVERLRTRTQMEWLRELIAAGVACGPINTIDQGVAFAEEVGLDPVVTVGQGDDAMPSVRHPITFSATPASYRLPPPALDQHGAEIRRWLAEPEELRPNGMGSRASHARSEEAGG